MILLDTSGLLAALDSGQQFHARCREVLEGATSPLRLSPFVLAELDHLLMRNLGASAQGALLEEVGRGVYELEAFDVGDISRAAQVVRQYSDLDVGLADASLVVLAERYSTADLLTLDEQHFRVMRFARRRHFRILPADA